MSWEDDPVVDKSPYLATFTDWLEDPVVNDDQKPEYVFNSRGQMGFVPNTNASAVQAQKKRLFQQNNEQAFLENASKLDFIDHSKPKEVYSDSQDFKDKSAESVINTMNNKVSLMSKHYDEPPILNLTEDQKYQLQMASQAEGEMANLSPAMQNVVPAMVNAGGNLASLVNRAASRIGVSSLLNGGYDERFDKAADRALVAGEEYNKVAGRLDENGVLPETVNRGIRNMIETVPLMGATGGVGGPYAPIMIASVQEANQAIKSGRDAGLQGEELARYAITEGIVEGGISALFQKVGWGGFENIYGGKQVVKSGIKDGLKQAGISTLQELPEEVITELTHNTAKVLYGTQKDALSPEQIYNTVRDTVVGTLITGATVNAPHVAQSMNFNENPKVSKQQNSTTKTSEVANIVNDTNYSETVGKQINTTPDMNLLEKSERNIENGKEETKRAKEVGVVDSGSTEERTDNGIPEPRNAEWIATAGREQLAAELSRWPDAPDDLVSQLREGNQPRGFGPRTAAEREAIAWLKDRYENQTIIGKEDNNGLQIEAERQTDPEGQVASKEISPPSPITPGEEISVNEGTTPENKLRSTSDILTEYRELNKEEPDYLRKGTKAEKEAQRQKVKDWRATNADRLTKLDEEYREAHAIESTEARTDAENQLQQMGFELTNESDSGSKYWLHKDTGIEVRTSDHDVPSTDERTYNAENGGKTWADSENSLVFPSDKGINEKGRLNVKRIDEQLSNIRDEINSNSSNEESANVENDTDPEVTDTMSVNPTELVTGESAYATPEEDIQESKKSPGITTNKEKTEASTYLGGRDIVNAMANIFDYPIREGRIKSQDAVGIHKRPSGVTRLKRGYESDITVAAHETGHHLDFTTDVLKSADETAKTELPNLDYDSEKRRVSEGFAEFIRLYMTKPDEAKKNAKNFYDHFNKWLTVHPETADKFARATELIDRYKASSAEERVGGQVSWSMKPERPVSQSRLSYFADQVVSVANEFYHAIKNEGHYIGLFTKAAKEKGYNPAKGTSPQDLYTFFNQGGPNTAYDWLINGPAHLNGNMERVGLGLRNAFENLNLKSKEDYKAFDTWLYARHALESWSKGKDPGVTRTDAQLVYDRGKSNPGWQEAANGVTAFHNNMVDVLVRSGSISQKSGALLKNAFSTYIPLQRLRESSLKWISGKTDGPGRNYIDAGNLFHKRVGSGLKVLDPIANTIKLTMQYAERAASQEVTNKIIDVTNSTPEMGVWAEKIPPELVPTTISSKEAWEKLLPEIAHDLIESGIDPEMLSEIDPQDAITIFRPDYYMKGDKPIARYINDGKMELYYINPYLYRSLKGLQYWRMPKLLDSTLGALTRSIKLGATELNVAFGMLSNPMRDYQTYVIQRTAGGLLDPAEELARYVSNMASKAMGGKGDPMYDLFERHGGKRSTRLGLDSNRLNKVLDTIVTGKEHVSLIDRMRDYVSITEIAPRMAEFVGVMKQNGWTRERLAKGETPPGNVIIQAVNAAHEVTVDFRRMGSVGKIFNQLICYFNANLEGADKAIRTAKDRPKASAVRLMYTAAIPAAIAWYMTRDDDWRKRKESWFDKYWIITDKMMGLKDADGSPVLRIPRPQEYGLVASGVENMLDAMYQHNPKKVEEWFTNSLSNLTPPVTPSGVGTAMQIATNKDVWGNPIIPKGLEDYEPKDQYTPQTSELMKAIGNWLNVSPAQVEHVANGLTGDLFRRYETMPEKIILGKDVEFMTTNPVTSGITFRKDYADSWDKFYEQYEAVNKQFNSAKLHGELTDELIANHERMDSYNSLMKEIRDVARKSTDKTTIKATERYLVGLADAALGREELKRYPNPLHVDISKLPSEIYPIVQKFQKDLREEAVAKQTGRRIGEPFEKYEARLKINLGRKAAARLILSEIMGK